VSRRKLGKLLVLLLCSGCFSSGYGQATHSRSHIDSLQVEYAAHPICTPVAKAVRAAHQIHPKRIYLSDHQEQFLAMSGLSPPRYLPANNPSLPQFATGETKFLTIATPEGDRLVAVEDTPLGSHGDFVTSVWIGKPKTIFAIGPGLTNFGEQDITAPDPAVIDLVVDFQNKMGWRSFTYPHATLPTGKMRFDDAVAPTPETLDSVKELFNGYVAQEPFLFKGLLYFIAGDPLQGWFLIYRVEEPANAQIECFAQWTPGSR
jgi:hypothetical protein